ncbi:hypothetical protein [Staphylococcus hominis]|uniref:hypothetical protein n=1 Tax=Staphylococcus hominis TaxID=1290 RepID=UPI001F55E7DD|nr:hypothetical protein [Staphylococcus hominis]MCI2896216.1 hypothetical protein [Staphylococcus hominis]MDS3901038.1 hypothetical protein [Staphylococcus hominis]
MAKNIGFKNGYALGLIKAGLSKEDKKIIDSLSIEEQERLAQLQRNKDPRLTEEVNKVIGKDNAFANRQDKMNEIREKGIEKQGIENPTKVTSNAFYLQNKANSFDDIYNLIGVGTHLSQKEQAKFVHYKDMKTNTYVQIAQNDEIIKQNNKIQEQNDEIIELLKQIANK